MFKTENEARQTKYEGYSFTVHFLVSLACEYELITTRSAFYQMTAKMQKAILNQMTPYAIEING